MLEIIFSKLKKKRVIKIIQKAKKTEQVSRSLEGTAIVSDVGRMPGPIREQPQ